MRNYTLEWTIMKPICFISKENSVYLYKLVQSDIWHSPSVSYKEFILVKAWSSEGNNVLEEGHRYFDYYYNGRIHRKQEVGINEFLPFADLKSFNIWSYTRDDDYAIDECKKWLNMCINNVYQDLHKKATKFVHDREFANNLKIVAKDGV